MIRSKSFQCNFSVTGVFDPFPNLCADHDDDDKSQKKGGGRGGGQIIGHICTGFLLHEKKGVNDRRTGFTSFRALFAPLQTMFCLKKHFYFWTENVECV